MDRDAVGQFMERFVEMASGAATVATLAVADRTGLLRSLRGAGPVTVDQAAQRSGLEPRYTGEILHQLVAAGVLDYHPADTTFLLTDEHAAVLADDTSPYAMTGWLDMLPTAGLFVDDIAEAARHGGGVPLERFPDRMVRGVARANTPSTRILLTRRWLPTMPEVVDRLEQGARVADVGCGAGGAALTMAEAYPDSEIFGYDIDPRAVELAIREADETGVSNVSFEVLAAERIPTSPGFDLITTFDVVHDLSRPAEALARFHQALSEDGTYLMMEPSVSPRLEENIDPKAALFYGVSVMFCLTQSLAAGGPGLGTAWGPEEAERLCREAGFTHFRRLPIDNPFSAFYEVRP